MADDTLCYEGDTECGHYQVVDTIYSGRPARVLYSGKRQAAQSGIARDGKPDLLFDYNQRFMELIRGVTPKRLLLIGGGAFTLPKAVADEFPNIKVTAVEIDGGLLEIATNYFGFVPSAKVRVYAQDGRVFLDHATPGSYDLILVDAFTHTDIPASLQTVEAAVGFRRALRPGGIVALNLIAAYRGQRSGVLRRQVAALRTVFSNLDLFPASAGESPWLPQNFILTAQNGTRALQPHLRYQCFALPDTTPSEALNDRVQG